MALSPVAFLAVALGGMAATGKALPNSGDFAQYSGLPSGLGIVGVALLIVIVDGFGEETGWRGYSLPQLQERFSPLIATLILAGFWAAWHIPSFFALRSYKGFSAVTGVGFVFGLACGAVVATWLYNRTGGSILAVETPDSAEPPADTTSSGLANDAFPDSPAAYATQAVSPSTDETTHSPAPQPQVPSLEL